MTENQKLREALQRIQYKATSLADAQVIALEALALPTADHFPDAGEMVVDHLPNAGNMTNGLTQSETDASASVSGLTGAPVDEREAFDIDAARQFLASFANWHPDPLNHDRHYRALAIALDYLGDLIGPQALALPTEQAPAQAVPSGWKLVPVEPTPDMEGAGRVNMAYGSCTARQVWAAMLAATPTATEQAEALALPTTEPVEGGEVAVVPREWRSALQKLAFMARTSGGTVGPDSGLMQACSDAEALLSKPYRYTAPPATQPEPTTQAQEPAQSGCTDAMVEAGFAALEDRGFRVGASDIGIDDLEAVFAAMIATQPQAQEPFGYFKPEPFGWTDCEATDEGAIALYEHPAADLTDEQIRAVGKQFFPKTILTAAWFGFARAIIAKVKGV